MRKLCQSVHVVKQRKERHGEGERRGREEGEKQRRGREKREAYIHLKDKALIKLNLLSIGIFFSRLVPTA